MVAYYSYRLCASSNQIPGLYRCAQQTCELVHLDYSGSKEVDCFLLVSLEALLPWLIHLQMAETDINI